MLQGMTTALQLPFFDQTLIEASAAERFAAYIGRALRFGRLVSSQVNLVSRLAQIDPHAFTSTQDVWAAAESVEGMFFRLYSTAHTINSTVHTIKKPSPPKASNSLAAVFDEDLAQRLAYMRELMDQSSSSGRRLPPQASRKREQAILDNLSIPPQVRLTIRRSRCLPVLIVFAHLMHAPSFTSKTARELVRETTQECVNDMIALMLGVHARTGIRPVTPPNGLELPAPMQLDALEKQWQSAQEAWAKI